jgi:hypothetical protein
MTRFHSSKNNRDFEQSRNLPEDDDGRDARRKVDELIDDPARARFRAGGTNHVTYSPLQ